MAWPLDSLRQSFLDGSLTRLVDPDAVLRHRVVEWVGKGDFGLGSGQDAADLDRVWFREPVDAEKVSFDAGVCLLSRGRAAALKAPSPEPETPPGPTPAPTPPAGGSSSTSTGTGSGSGAPPKPEPPPPPPPQARTLRVQGDIPAEVWNRVGTRLIPKLRAGAGGDLTVGVTCELSTSGSGADALLTELRQILDDLQLAGRVRIDAD